MQTLKTILGTSAFCLLTVFSGTQSSRNPNLILGKWKAKEKVLTIQIYKQGTIFNAKIVSFTDHHNNTPTEQRLDDKNPNPTMRKRKMIGMNVLSGLKYSESEGKWTGGEIYDDGTSKTYKVNAELISDGDLSIRAYKGITLLGKHSL